MTTKLELENAHSLKRIAAALERIADNQTISNALEVERQCRGYVACKKSVFSEAERQFAAMIEKGGGE